MHTQTHTYIHLHDKSLPIFSLATIVDETISINVYILANVKTTYKHKKSSAISSSFCGVP